MGIRIAIVGAGSRSFGSGMIRDVYLSDALNKTGIELMLMDIVPEYLAERTEYARRVARRLGRRADVTATTDLDEALGGADYVITAIEVNRFLYWSQDFHIPRQYGFMQIYGENGGPGGLFHALRNMAPMINIARRMEPLPEAITAMLRLQASIQKLLVEAFAENSRHSLLQALLLDPTAHSYRNAVALINEMCELQKDILPSLKW